MIRAVLGIDLPAEVRGALQVQQFLLPLPRKVDPDQLHLTLVFLGDCPEPTLDAVHFALEDLRAASFSIAVQGLGLFGKARPHTAWAGITPSAPLLRIQAKVESIARRAGCPLDARKFTPHVTLGHFPPPAPPDRARLERAVVMGAGFRTQPWLVDRVVLWQSQPHASGTRHEVLARYPLVPPPAA